MSTESKPIPAGASLYAQLWRLAYAGRSFEHVVCICDHIIQTPIPDTSPLFYPMITAAYALYSRPFTKNRVIGKMSSKFVPKQSVRLHKQIIVMRDQLLLHSDADPSISLEGLAGNSVRLFRAGYKLDVGAYEMKPRTSHIPDIRDLARALRDLALDQLRHLLAEHVSKVPAEDGEFEVDLKQQKFVPVMPSRRREA